MDENSTATSSYRLAIAEDMNIYNAIPQKAQLVAALAQCQDLEIDLSLVGEIDTSGFQLLLLIKREAARAGKTARIVAHSAPVREVLDFFNMAAYFGDPLVIPAREQR
jgi:ABC-type transporter Mla MlaB component